MPLTRLTILLLAWATGAACRDVAGTRPSAIVELTELERPVMAHGRYDTGEWRIECTIRIQAAVDRSAIEWIDGVMTWSTLGSSAATEVDPLTALQVAEFWSGGAVAASLPQASHWIFWNAEPFSLRLGFRYEDVATRKGGSTEYDFDCPARAPLTGKYVLQSIDGQPLPAYGSYVDFMYYDTLTFAPAYHYTVSMAYRSGVDYDGSVRSLTPYTVRSADTLDLPLVRVGLTAPSQPASLSGDTLVWRLRSQDRVFVWRFLRQ